MVLRLWEREFQNRQQQEVDAKASKEETTSSSKRGIMLEMLDTPGALAMKKTAEIQAASGQILSLCGYSEIRRRIRPAVTDNPRKTGDQQIFG
jgi:hypothetical protein